MTTPGPRKDVDDSELRVTHPEQVAAGPHGVEVALRFDMAQMGAKRTARTLLRVNQPDGFDCPGCAWPEPHPTKRLEFCENGAKAVGEEATRRRVEPSGLLNCLCEVPVTD